MAMRTNPVRGTRDFGPKQMELREYLMDKITASYKKRGFTKIQTPVIENIDLLLGSEGGENLQMIFKIMKRGEKLKLDKEGLSELDLADMGLRYDLTLPLSRFYANSKADLPTPFKAIQMGEVFRAERPQKGRFRSFVQCDIDIIGDETSAAEMELLDTTAKTLYDLDFKDFTICINDRRILSGIIEFSGFSTDDINSVCITLDKLDKVGKGGVKEELEKKGYDVAAVVKLMDVLAQMEEATILELEKFDIDKKVLEDLNEVVETVTTLSDGKYKVEFDPSLVRGMGYYTGMIFEAKYGSFGSSIAGGGRYDKMIGKLTNEDVPAVGFSIGFERIITILEEEGFEIPKAEQKIAFLYNPEEDKMVDVIKAANQFRDEGKTVNIVVKAKKFGKQLKRLEAQGFDSFCVYGDELEIKEM